MNSASINQAVLLGWYWENPDTCIQHNDWHHKWIKEDPERFYAFASIHTAMSNPVEELKKRLDQGFAGIGECHPGVQGFAIKSPSLIKCLEFAC